MSTFFILSMLFAMMQVAISKCKETHLTTVAYVSDPMPNLEVVLNDLGNGSMMPSEYNHVRTRICVNTGIRFVIEYVDMTINPNELFRINTDFSRFWDGCPYQNISDNDTAYEVSFADAENMLNWVLKRAENIQYVWGEDLIEQVYI